MPTVISPRRTMAGHGEIGQVGTVHHIDQQAARLCGGSYLLIYIGIGTDNDQEAFQRHRREGFGAVPDRPLSDKDQPVRH